MKISNFLLAGLLLAPGVASADLLLTCTAQSPPGEMPFHWGVLKIDERAEALRMEVVEGNPQDEGQIADLTYTRMVFPHGVSTQMFHGTWETPSVIGMRTVTIYLSSDRKTLTYIAEMLPYQWSCAPDQN